MTCLIRNTEDLFPRQTFYSKLGWHPFPSSHVALRPAKSQAYPIQARYLYAQDLPALCEQDEHLLRKEIEQRQSSSSSIRVALIPDIETMQWHHAREEFAGKEMLGRDPELKGALARTSTGARVWCIWTRTFGDDQVDNTLNVLRVVTEGDQVLRFEQEHAPDPDCAEQTIVDALANVFRAAQFEAAQWPIKDIQIWNPTRLTILAAQKLEPASKVVHREKESIASLRWHGANSQDGHEVDWVGNEKYGWC